MQIIHYCLISFFLGCIYPLSAQENDSLHFPVQIDSVLIFGNKTTQNKVILREIPYQLPATLTSNDFQLIKNRLGNLFLFKRVILTVANQGLLNYLVIEVAERWYIYPLPILELNERNWNKISYGFKLSHLNFRGMNERLHIGGWLGYNPSFFIRYANPWIGKRAKMMFGMRLSRRKISNRIKRFEENHLGGMLILGKRLGLNISLTAFFSLRRIGFPSEYQNSLVSGNKADVSPKFSLQYLNDHRDLFEYPRKGYLIKWSATRSGFTRSQPNFWRYRFDHRLYIKLSNRFSIGGRNAFTLTDRKTPIYDRIFIGFSERIRGYFSRQFSAKNTMIHNYEMRISLLPLKYYSWEEAPFMADLFQQLKYGLSMGLFMDSGVVWNHTRELAIRKHYSGFGMGLHIHLPQIDLLRIDHAWNDQGKSEWIIEAGVSF